MNMNKLARQELGNIGIEHILYVLDYPNRLCSCLNDDKLLRLGSTFSYLPKRLDIADATNLRRGGLYEDSRSYLPQYIHDKITQKDCIALFDDAMAEPGDEFLANLMQFSFEKDMDVYYHVDSHTSSVQHLSTIISATNVAWHFVAVLLRPTRETLKQELTQDMNCSALSENMIELIVGAYDGEGYVHWIGDSSRDC